MSNPLPSLKERVAQLIQTPSVSAASAEWDMSNKPVIHLLADWFQQLGFSIHIQELANNKANLIATYGTGTSGLVLAGHTDTVPYNKNRWQHDPFHLTEKDNRWYGLGSADMKSFFALIIEAVLPLLDKPFTAPLIVLATADEESSMAGARALSHAQFTDTRAAIIGEPTLLRPINMHKSITMQSLKVVGQSGHSSNPALGKNALDAMHDMISALKTVRTELCNEHQNAHFAVTHPTMNLGCIHGGDSPNRICNSCELHFDFRGLPGMNNSDVVQMIHQRIQPIADEHAVSYTLSDLFDGVEAFAESASSELVQLAEQLSGAAPSSVAFATEAPFLQALGMQTIVLGPGSIDQAHQPDEYIGLDQIEPSVTLLRQFIQHYCLQQVQP